MNSLASTFDARRARAAESFRASGVPHRRIEEWKYSDLRALVGANDVEAAGPASWSLAAPPLGVELFDLASGPAPDWVQQRLGLLNGAGAMQAASLGFARAGFALRVPKRATGELHVTWSNFGQARVLIIVEEDAALTLLEEANAFSGLRNIGMEIFLAPGAKLTQTRLSSETSAVQVTAIVAKLASGAIYRGHFTDFGSKLSRTEVHVALEGEGAQAHLSGTSVLKTSHADVTTHVDHVSGNTQSTQLFKMIAGGKARGVYQGKVTVRHGADGADSRQTAKGLLLSDGAEIDLKPELEILADDVKCAHGAAVGDLEPEWLFYLRARGIPEAEARAMLMRAFLEEAVAEIEDEKIRAGVWKDVEASLAEIAP